MGNRYYSYTHCEFYRDKPKKAPPVESCRNSQKIVKE